MLFTTTGAVETACAADVSSGAGRSSVEEDEEEKLPDRREGTSTSTGGGGGTLQVAVLLQMPCPSHAEAQQNAISEELLGHRGELAIGLIEVPWTSEKRTPS